tara:strand:+ start:1331 stop:1534 length:204 start_codon:yes stop_codon:yes gene_type:complete
VASDTPQTSAISANVIPLARRKFDNRWPIDEQKSPFADLAFLTIFQIASQKIAWMERGIPDAPFVKK